jgi:hypothetical protein
MGCGRSLRARAAIGVLVLVALVLLLVKGEHDDHFTLRSGVAPE